MRARAHVSRIAARHVVFIDLALTEPGELMPRMLELGLTRTMVRTEANVFVVDDVSALGQRARWCLAVGGGVAATKEYIMSGVKTGNALSFKSAAGSARFIHITDAFRAAHPVLAGIVDSKMPGSKWRAVDRDSLLERVARGRADDLNKNIVLLVAAEQRDAAYGHVKLKLTATDAIVWMTSLDEAGNCSNTCGR